MDAGCDVDVVAQAVYADLQQVYLYLVLQLLMLYCVLALACHCWFWLSHRYWYVNLIVLWLFIESFLGEGEQPWLDFVFNFRADVKLAQIPVSQAGKLVQPLFRNFLDIHDQSGPHVLQNGWGQINIKVNLPMLQVVIELRF